MPISKEKQIVIKAINKLGRRVSVPDIASKTGLPLNSTALTINQIAAETGGHLQVSPAGDIAYVFPVGYQSKYITRGISHILEKIAQQTFDLAFYLLRISFGMMLVISLAIIAMIFFAILIANSRGRDNDQFSFDLDFFDWLILRDIFLWDFDYSAQGKNNNSPNQKTITKRSFLYDCFSFLFGDGNPNHNLEELRWQEIATLIRKNNGTLVADQLAPYTGKSPDNEDEVLPILVRFDGQPVVSESGNIIYKFPSMQTTALNTSITNKISPFLKESLWQFSTASAESLTWIAILASVNFLGGWWLFYEIGRVASLSPLLPILTVLVIYGSAFILVPFCRYLIIQSLNKSIESRNKVRQSYASRLDSPDQKLTVKLSEAKDLQLTENKIDRNNLVYDTEKGALEQNFTAP